MSIIDDLIVNWMNIIYVVLPHQSLFMLCSDPNKLQSGQCGHRCDGLDGIDILGVYEYDTVADKSIMSWTMDDGKSGDPFPSPSGGK